MKRDYEGPPIDGTYQDISERPYVEVPSDKSHDGEVKTNVGDGTSLQKFIKRVKFNNPKMSYGEIAQVVDCNRSYVYEVLNNSTRGKYERYHKNEWSEFTKNEKLLIKLKLNTDLNNEEIAREVDVSGAFVHKVLEANQWLVSE